MKKIIVAGCCLAFCQMVFSQAPDTTRFSILMTGLKKGFYKSWKNKDGSYTDWYQYNDRGRGDSLWTTYRMNAQGIPMEMQISGVDYMKNQVEEQFSLSNGVARWKNASENEERKVTGPAFYMGLKGSAGRFYHALKANNNSLSLLPYGKASLKEVARYTVKKDGKSKNLILVSISGMGMTPSYSWVDDQYEEFGQVNDWFSSIREGYEFAIPALLQIQKKIEGNFFRNIAKQFEIPTPVLIIQQAAVFDAVHATLIPKADILVRNGKIEQVSTDNTIKIPGARIINGKGMTVMPGLWDMHVHFAADLDGILHMAAGVTHVRDMGNDSSLLLRMKQVRNGELIGPTVEIASGFIDGAGPLAAPTGALINSVEEGIAAIREYSRQGYQQIKLYSSIRPEWVKPLAAEAHAHHMRVAGHIPAFMTAEQAIAAGYDEITHMNMLALNFFGDTIDTRSPNRFRVPAERTAQLDLTGERMQSFISLLKNKGIAVDPTLSVFENLFTARDGVMEDRYKPIVNRFPANFQRSIRAGGGGLPVPEGMDETYRASFEAFCKILKLLYDNQVTIVAGTDGLAGFDLHRELELYVKAGIPPAKVLQLATYGTAAYAGKSATLGSIEPGRGADFIIVQGNPLENISDIRNTRWVIKGQKVLNTEALYKTISIGKN